ncbi:MAG TPA: hypothetical protein ACFYEK_12680 [Candidatus Wunengus sp. YC60]|uniref:hypothetical protein n=1 Tax=Candidatus Wunengus sp. YC60 TaxID=3367697 RepID=UPI0040251A0F
MKEHKAQRNVKDGYQNIANVVTDVLKGKKGLAVSKDIVQSNEYWKGDGHFLGKKSQKVAYKRDYIPQNRLTLMGLEIEEKGGKIESGSHNVFAIAYGVDSLSKYRVGTKDKAGHKGHGCFRFFVWFASDYVKYTGKQEKQKHRIEAMEKQVREMVSEWI